MSSLKKDSFDNVKSYYNYIKQWYKVNTEEDFTCSREGGDDHMPRWVCKGEIKVLDYKGRSKTFKADGVSESKKDAKDKFIGLIIKDFEDFVSTPSTNPTAVFKKPEEKVFKSELVTLPKSSNQIEVSSAENIHNVNHISGSKRFLTPKNEKGFIGCGGFGMVFVCVSNENTKKLLALKVPKNEKETYTHEFDYHMKASENKFVAKVYETTSIHNRKAIIMEYCSRGNLRELTKMDLLPPSVICKIFLQVAEAIAYLHRGNSHRMTHNDIKPDNILITKDFEARLSDFGGATVATQTLNRQTIDREKRGVPFTSFFISPERHKKLNVLPKKSDDVYSFGVCLYVSLCDASHIFHTTFHERYRSFERELFKPIRENLHDLEKDGKEVEADTLYGLLKIIHLCCAETPDTRPSMECLHDKLEQIYDRYKLGNAVRSFVRQEMDNQIYPIKDFKFDDTWVDVKTIQMNP